MELRIRRRPVHVLIGLGFILGVGCDGKRSEPSTIRVIREAAAWMSVDNSFTKDCNRKPPDNHFDRLPREGVLVQLGHYKNPDGTGGHTTFNSIKIGVDEYQKVDGFYWIDVVSDFQLSPGEPKPDKLNPMEKELGACLYPNTATDFPCFGDPGCCSRKLHPLIEPEAMITIWGGTKGYKVSADPLSSEQWRVRFTFEIEDPIEIHVFRSRSGGGHFEDVKSYSAGRYAIDITSTETQPHNSVGDPPWP